MSHIPVPSAPPNLYAGPQLRSPRGLSVAVTVLLAVCLAADLLSIGTEFHIHDMLGGSISGDEADRADMLLGAVGLVQVLALAATAVVFIIWFHRVRVNAGIFAQDSQSKGAGWAIGGWFIPFGALWIPRQIASDVWNASTQAAPDGSWRKVSQVPVTAWWSAWVLSMALSWVGQGAGRSEVGSVSRSTVELLMAADAADIAAAVLAVLFVRKLTRMQHIKATEGPYATV
ncbi:DUF4328 domain-containing protein [Streptomyces sp. NPDC050738]|uniref:DUF4328 domain-containing protein n=1 Tax=Streptomyces sp. NPDC050738 TaxID=3154744 RepID=UPI0034308B2C